MSICFSWNSAIDSFHIYIYTSVGIQYAFEGSSSWHILCWQDCWISTLRYFQYHWKSSLMSLFLMKNWFTRSISNDLWPTSLFWENILLPDYGHHWVAIFVWMPFGPSPKHDFTERYPNHHVTLVDEQILSNQLIDRVDTHMYSIYIHSHVTIFIYAPMYISIPTLGFVYSLVKSWWWCQVTSVPTRPPDLNNFDMSNEKKRLVV